MANKKKGTVDFLIIERGFNYAEDIRRLNNPLFARFESDKHVGGDSLFFSNSITLDFAFAKDLRLFDIIEINCFEPIDDEGREVILQFQTASFIVINKSYFDRDMVYLYLYESHTECCFDDQRLLSSGHMRIGNEGERIMLDGMEE